MTDESLALTMKPFLKELNMVDVRRDPIPKKTYVPIGCLVAVHAYPPKPLSSLLLPDTAKGKELFEAQECLVIAVGPEVKQIKEGDVVLVQNSVGMCVHAGQKTLLIREDHVAGVVCKVKAGANVEAANEHEER